MAELRAFVSSGAPLSFDAVSVLLATLDAFRRRPAARDVNIDLVINNFVRLRSFDCSRGVSTYSVELRYFESAIAIRVWHNKVFGVTGQKERFAYRLAYAMHLGYFSCELWPRLHLGLPGVLVCSVCNRPGELVHLPCWTKAIPLADRIPKQSFCCNPASPADKLLAIIDRHAPKFDNVDMSKTLAILARFNSMCLRHSELKGTSPFKEYLISLLNYFALPPRRCNFVKWATLEYELAYRARGWKPNANCREWIPIPKALVALKLCPVCGDSTRFLGHVACWPALVPPVPR